MSTCEEYVLNELEKYKEENALLKKRIEELTLEKVDAKVTANNFKEIAEHYYKVIQTFVELSNFCKSKVYGSEEKTLTSYFIWVSDKTNKKVYDLLEPFAKEKK